jgi:hypothetical protein
MIVETGSRYKQFTGRKVNREEIAYNRKYPTSKHEKSARFHMIAPFCSADGIVQLVSASSDEQGPLNVTNVPSRACAS